MFCVCFFCVKQKTAYEMRISDWSSDVCSSDLPDSRGQVKLVRQRVGSLDETRDRSRLVSPIIIYAGQGGKNEARDMHGVRLRIIVVVVHAREPLERRVRRSQAMELLAYHTQTNGEITPDERQRTTVLDNRLRPKEFMND